MKLAQLTRDSELSYWKIVKQDYCDYYFFIYDWLLQRNKTQVFLALKDEAVAGLMLVYDGGIVQLRGDPEGIGFLLRNLNFGFTELQAPAECEQAVLDKFPQPKLEANIVLMSLQKGEEHHSASLRPERLSAGDAQDVAQLMNESYPEMWSTITPETVGHLLSAEGTVWLGIKQDGKLASFGYANLTPKVSHIAWIATKQPFRNRGYATAITSALAKECLNNASTAIIYVMDNNEAAKNVYSKVGFKPCKSFFFLKT